MERLLEYIYTGTVPTPGDVEEVMSLVEASDKYQLNELKNRCLRHLCTQISADNVGRIAILAYMHNAEIGLQEEIRHHCRRWVWVISRLELLIVLGSNFFVKLQQLGLTP